MRYINRLFTYLLTYFRSADLVMLFIVLTLIGLLYLDLLDVGKYCLLMN